MYTPADKNRFDSDFKDAVNISKPNGYDDPTKVNNWLAVAWEVYWNARTTPLQMQIFGRHKKNEMGSGVIGPGIELYDEAYPLMPRETEAQRAKRVGPEIAARLTHPTGQKMSKIEFNFGIASHETAGSIQRLLDKDWIVNVNDAWLLGGVHGHQEFHFASAKFYKNFFADLADYNLTVTGRELLGLLTAGYVRATGYDASLGDVMFCKNESTADEMTLVSYATIAQQYEGKGHNKTGELQRLASQANFIITAGYEGLGK